MEAADSSPPAEVSTVAVLLPPFWVDRPAVWFAQAEGQFSLAGISSEKTKFCHVIWQLDHRYAAELEDITSPLEQDPYTTLRTELMRGLSPSREQHIRQLPTLEMGDHKPSQFLGHLRSLAPDVPDNCLHTILSSRLPPNIRTILVGQPQGSLDAAASCADRVSEIAPQPALASVGPLPTAPHFCRGSRISPARWQHSALCRTVFAQASGTPNSTPGTLAPTPGIPATAP
jgi:hypothetical protein